jgi:predicted RNA-binding protein with TRAM domain
MKPVNEKGGEKTLEVEIERILPGGVGLAHAEGLTVFVSLAAPGDIVRARIGFRGRVASLRFWKFSNLHRFEWNRHALISAAAAAAIFNS